MVQIKAQKGLRAVKDVGTKQREDGEAFDYGAQGGDSGHPERSKGEGDARRGPPKDRLPRINGAAFVPQV